MSLVCYIYRLLQSDHLAHIVEGKERCFFSLQGVLHHDRHPVWNQNKGYPNRQWNGIHQCCIPKLSTNSWCGSSKDMCEHSRPKWSCRKEKPTSTRGCPISPIPNECPKILVGRSCSMCYLLHQ